MTENVPAPPDPTVDEVAADLAAQLADPARYAIMHRDRGAAAQRLAERFSTPTVPDDTEDGAI